MSPVEQRTVAVGAAAHGLADTILDLGGTHPSAHGALKLVLTVDGDTVVTAEPVVGFMHRGAEKLFEARDYRQILMLANRHDWLSAFANEVGIALTVEQMLGLEVPPRATWLRTLLSELNRVLASLMFLGGMALECGDLPAGAAGHAGREVLQSVMEEATGGRVHFMFNRIGGLLTDVPAGWTGRVRAALDEVRRLLPPLERLVREDAAFAERTRGVGVLTAEVAAAYGVSGPVARAAGLALDVRRDEPYLAYGDLEVPLVGGTAGDSHERFRVLLDTVPVALDLAEQCLDRLPPGPVDVPLPKSVRAPEGATYAWTENPLGAMGYYLVSRGDRAPWRLAMRTPSFNNVSVLPALLPGARVTDLVTILASLFFVVGDIDK